MATLRLILEYDGSDFEGWQRQAGDKRTVQGALIRAFERVTGETVRVTGSGRTDAGVHAEAQVASASLESSLAPEELRRALNAVLPPDVVIRHLEPVDDDFDAHLESLRHCCEVASIFGTNLVRIFSFYPGEGKAIIDQRAEAIDSPNTSSIVRILVMGSEASSARISLRAACATAVGAASVRITKENHLQNGIMAWGT